MRCFSRLAAAALAAALQACAAGPAVAPAPAALAEARPPVTILVAIDGFRADYLDRGITPTLSGLAAQGASAAMRPSFPSKTFPNHYALVTGLRPDRNGIVANTMEDPRRPGERFTMATLDPFWWDEAEPIWVSAEKAGIRTGTMFWPGSTVAVRGTWPSAWQQFRHEMPGTMRVDAVIDWLRRPAAARPHFLTLYFNTVDDAGHDFGPDAPETDAALAEVDALVGRLVRELRALGQPANLVIVADHGMAALRSDRVIAIDAIADPADYRAVEDGPYASFHATPGREAAFEAALLAPHPHMQCWRKDAIPERFHYGRNPRVPPYLCLAELGWTIRAKPVEPGWVAKGGNHGWDPQAPEMHALFIANGPAIAARGRMATFDNVDVYPLLRRLVGLPPQPGIDGAPGLADLVAVP